MTEALSLAPAAPPQPQPPDLLSYSHIPPVSLPQEETADDDDGEIACICAFNGDDGNTIQCDKCLRWQHISCYYPPPKEVPGEDQKHYCTDCVPQPDLDSRRATERQRRLVEARNGANGVKRTSAKTSRKKLKDSPSLTAQVNGWPDRQAHIHGHDRKSASPRDQPPPAKKPKTTHRASTSTANTATRKRSTAINPPPVQSRSQSPELELDNASFIPQYSEEFLHLYQPHSPSDETDTNILNGIAVSNMLTSWLTDPEAVASVTNGLSQADIFKRWDGRMEDIPGQPAVDVDWVEDPSFTSDDGMNPRWARLTLASPIAQGTFIGELRGHVGLKEEYVHEIDGRWNTLYHPEPFVFFHPQLPIFIDARKKGTKFRFVRRSCQPNAELQTIITESTEYHFCFMATRDIVAGEEITVGWQVPEPLRASINSSLAHSNNIHKQVRDSFSTWVSVILSNSGPCACNSPSHPPECLMARYDRRGQSPQLRPLKVNKRKKKLAALEPGIVSRSRSASAAPKAEQDENMLESRSVSGSRGSISRDITPSAHHTDDATARSFPQELSERERKKLMREEEMFKRQEQESGRSKKPKRNSGGSNLSTPIATTSARLAALDAQKKSRTDGEPKSVSSQTNGSSRYADAGTSSRPGMSSRTSSGKRKATALKASRQDSGPTARNKSATYTDASVQCDLDGPADDNQVEIRPRKRFVSVAQRLFNRCISNQLKLKDSVELLSPSVSDTMDIDTQEAAPTIEPAVAPSSPPKEDSSTSKPDDGDVVMAEVGATEPVQAELKVESPVAQPLSASNVDKELSPRTKEPAPVGSPIVQHSLADKDEQPPPVTATTTTEPQPQSETVTENPDVTAEPAASARPAMHLDMPPPPLNMTAAQQMTNASMLQSPALMTPGTAASMMGPLFSPSVASAVSPSPIRKKLSLSDYTKRSKAKETPAEEKAPSTLSKEIKDGQEDSTAPIVQDTDVANELPEEAVADHTATKEPEDQAALGATESSVVEAPKEPEKTDVVMTESPAAMTDSAPATMVTEAPVDGPVAVTEKAEVAK